ncbi:uroporphyrinogen-III synthase [Roseovarius aestuariivivens]|uniref:uroporphyrinogen-III synthase n=1 Tax=Roseovarius aestuariivivens TaxID=1888910 RepID=UPI001080F52D|nr:uroporphyrinogen-III synthase [Roseovarius aestuariivivens]
MPASILITRPAPSAERFAKVLQDALGPACNIVFSPLMQIKNCNLDLSDLSAATIIFTSRHAVEAFSRLDARRNAVCYTVGPATKAAAQEAGFDPVAADGTGEALTRKILSDGPPEPCLYVRGNHVAYDIQDELVSAGLETHMRIVYRQIECPLSLKAKRLLCGKDPVIVPLFSPRSAELFLQAGPFEAPVHAVAISSKVADRLGKGNLKTVVTAIRPDQDAMVKSVSDLWTRVNRLETPGGAQ